MQASVAWHARVHVCLQSRPASGTTKGSTGGGHDAVMAALQLGSVSDSPIGQLRGCCLLSEPFPGAIPGVRNLDATIAPALEPVRLQPTSLVFPCAASCGWYGGGIPKGRCQLVFPCGTTSWAPRRIVQAACRQPYRSPVGPQPALRCAVTSRWSTRLAVALPKHALSQDSTRPSNQCASRLAVSGAIMHMSAMLAADPRRSIGLRLGFGTLTVAPSIQGPCGRGVA
ncbi:hypothetical protein ANO11243_040850 [Dothideomycetidae sp. 11243]|nr:hypothetical protein ANO11243_040850 [fungal sp. No.11243]